MIRSTPGHPATPTQPGATATAAPAIHLVAAQLVVAGTAAVVNVTSSHALGPAGRGALALTMQIAYLATLVLLAAGDRAALAVAGDLGRDGAQRALDALARHAVGRLAVLTTAGLAVLTALALIGGPVTVSTTLLAAIAAGATLVAADIAQRQGRALAIVGDATRLVPRVAIASALGTIAAAALLTALHRTEPALWCVAFALPLGLAWRRAHRRLLPAGPAATAHETAVLRHRSRRLAPAMVAQTVTLRVDRLLLPLLAGTAPLGRYVAVATCAELVAWPVTAAAEAALPRWRAAARAGRLCVGRTITGAVAATTIVALAAGAALHALVPVLFGHGFETARELVLPLFGAAAALGTARILGVSLVARDRLRVNGVAEVAGVAVAVTAYLALIPGHGAAGAAYGSLLGYATTAAVLAAAHLHRGIGAPVTLATGSVAS